MPDQNLIKTIIDSGAYAAGSVACAGPTVAWQAALGNLPARALAHKYIKAAQDLEAASEAMVTELMTRAAAS